MALIGEMHYLTIGGNTYSIPVSGGSTVTVERALTSGTKSATISVDGTSYDLYAPTPNAGTVTSVRVQATSPVQSSTSTAQSSTLNTTISLANNYGDTKNPYASKTKNYVLAAPATENGVPSFRALVAADIPDLSDTYLTSYTETDPVFSASAAAGITATDISNWNAKVSDDKTWNGIVLEKISRQPSGNIIIPYIDSVNNKANYIVATPNGGSANILPKYDTNGYLKSTTPSANDNSTKVATTAYVDSAVGGISIPTKTSDLTNDSGFITSYTETDPVFSASAASGITSSDITTWNGKSDFSGSYNDLTDKPTIPTVPTNISAFINDAGYLTSYTETDPTVPSWAKQSDKPTYTASEVGAQPTLVSGTNIKTINGASLLGSGDITVTGGSQVQIVRWTEI